MGTAVSKRKSLRTDATSSVAAKVRAARAFGEYLSHTDPENRNGADLLLSDTFIGQDINSPVLSHLQNSSLPPKGRCVPIVRPAHPQQPQRCAPMAQQTSLHQAGTPECAALPGPSKRRLSAERRRSSSSEEQAAAGGTDGRAPAKPARVYTISKEVGAMTPGGRGSEESLELELLRGPREEEPSSHASSASSHGHHRGNHHRSSRRHGGQAQQGGAAPSRPLQSSGSAHNIRDCPGRRGGLRDGDCGPECVACVPAPCHSQRSLDLDTPPRDGGKHRKKLERMYSEDRTSSDDREEGLNSWFPKENMFSFQTATTTMQAAFRGIAEKKRRKGEQEAAAPMERVMQKERPLCKTEINRNFRKHLRMVGSRRVKVQTFADRRAKSFSRSWSDPTPVKPDSLHDSRDSGDLPASPGTLDEGSSEDAADWEEEREVEREACEGDDFIPPKIMLISSKVPKAEYVPNIVRKGDASIIPILYDHEHATFDDIIEEIEKKLTAYRKGCRIWNMLIFCQGGPGHLYLLKNKVATFAKVEKEEDMIQFWWRLGRLTSKLNPQPNLIHIMGCYVLGSANGEKLIENLTKLMRPYSVEFKSPLELSAQGKEMIEMYFDFRLFRLWKSRQHSKMFDYDDLL